ncbi:MAG: AAA family ATPase [Anaerolineae bacterium]
MCVKQPLQDAAFDYATQIEVLMQQPNRLVQAIVPARSPARIEYVRVENYRALKTVELKELTPLTVLLGPNGSGKSTVFDAFSFIEEPENYLHPRLLPELAEECRAASERTQLLVTTHSPFFLNSIRPEEVRVLYRDEHGYTQVVRAADIPGIPDFMKAGASLGHLWLEGRFGLGDPLTNAGAPGVIKVRR